MITIRPATRNDAVLILELIRGLAEYEPTSSATAFPEILAFIV